MDEKKSIELANAIRELMLFRYEDSTANKSHLKNLNDIAKKAYALLDDTGFSTIFDDGLINAFENKNIFYEPHIEFIRQQRLPTAYLGDIIQIKDNIYVCTINGRFKGIDFYNGHINKKPTVIQQVSKGILIHRDNVIKGFKGLYPNKDSEIMAKEYVDCVSREGLFGSHNETTKSLINYLKTT